MDCEGDEDTSFCPGCMAENFPLGMLASLVHYRCRDCGWEWDEPQEPDPDAQRDDRSDHAQQQQYEQDYYD